MPPRTVKLSSIFNPIYAYNALDDFCTRKGLYVFQYEEVQVCSYKVQLGTSAVSLHDKVVICYSVHIVQQCT